MSNEFTKIWFFGARWAPTSYKWSYKPYKWPYKWVTGVITLLIGVITPFITSRGPTLWGMKYYPWSLGKYRKSLYYYTYSCMMRNRNPINNQDFLGDVRQGKCLKVGGGFIFFQNFQLIHFTSIFYRWVAQPPTIVNVFHASKMCFLKEACAGRPCALRVCARLTILEAEALRGR